MRVLLPAAPTLDRLPTEILERIALHSRAPDCRKLRTLCRRIESSLFRAFATRFFQKRRFWRHYLSLKALEQISQSRLSRYLTHLTIGIEQINPAKLELERWPRIDAHRKFHKEHQQFLASGASTMMLAKSLSSLTKLKTIRVQDFLLSSGASNLGWGLKHLARECEIILYYKDDLLGPEADCTQMVLAAMSYARAYFGLKDSPKSLELIAGPGGSVHRFANRCDRIDCKPLYIPPYLDSYITPMLETLREFHLLIRGSRSGERNYLRTPAFREFLCRTKRLKRLTLSHGEVTRYDGRQEDDLWGFWEWLAGELSPPLDTDRFSSLSLNQLQDIQIGHLSPSSVPFSHPTSRTVVPAEALLLFLCKVSSTLIRLSLYAMCLADHPDDADASCLNCDAALRCWDEDHNLLSGQRTQPEQLRGPPEDVWGRLFFLVSRRCHKLKIIDIRRGFMFCDTPLEGPIGHCRLGHQQLDHLSYKGDQAAGELQSSASILTFVGFDESDGSSGSSDSIDDSD